MKPRTQRFRPLLILTVAFLVAAAAYTSLLIVRRQESLEAISRYNVTWLLSQSVQEVVRLQAVIGASTIPGTGIYQEDVQLWLDIVSSRLLLLDSGEVREFITSSEELKATRDHLRNVVAVARPLVDLVGKPGNARLLLQKFEELNPKLVRLAAAGNARGSELASSDLHQLSLLHWIFSGMLAALILCSFGLVAMLHTLTNRLVQRNQELIAAMTGADMANRAKSQFLSTMSHEIRTPLNGVLGVTELLQRTHLDSEQTRFVEAIASAGHTLLSLLGDILDLAKIEEGKVQLEFVDFDIRKLLSDITNVYHAMATARDLLMVTHLDDLSQGWVRGDPTRLRQVLSNLLGNAVKFTTHGEVRLHVEHLPSPVDDPRPWWRFTVEDTGIGITPEAVDKLFQRFSQADASTTRQFGGTGLGLAICRHLVELMDGHIHVSSVPGKGSCFQVDVPLEAALVPQVPEPKVLLAPISTGARILVAEDNTVNQLVIRSLLSRLGATVTVVENGEKAVAQIGQETFDLVFMDCQMPVMDGFEATQRIRTWERSNSRKHAIPIIALTANALAGDREICIAAGMTDYITKPVTAAGLSKILEQHLPATMQPADAPGTNARVMSSSRACT